MLIYYSRLLNTPVLSLQTGVPVGYISDVIVDPDSLKIAAFRLSGPLIRGASLLNPRSIRENSHLGMIIDDADELFSDDDVVKISKILQLNFKLINLRVETKKKHYLGKTSNFTVTDDNFTIQQLIVKRPIVKGFLDPELTIPRKEILEVTNHKIIVKNEEKVIKERATKEDFVPNFVNPFRKTEPSHAPVDIETPVGPDKQ